MRRTTFNISKHYERWPKELKEEFREELFYDRCWIRQQTFYNWLVVGVPANSKLNDDMRKLVDQYNKKAVGIDEPALLRKSVL